jgi:hypothetical protein
LASDTRPTEPTANIPSEVHSAIANTNEVVKPDRTATVGAADTVVPTMACSVMLRVMAAPEVSNTSKMKSNQDDDTYKGKP